MTKYVGSRELDWHMSKVSQVIYDGRHERAPEVNRDEWEDDAENIRAEGENESREDIDEDVDMGNDSGGDMYVVDDDFDTYDLNMMNDMLCVQSASKHLSF